MTILIYFLFFLSAFLLGFFGLAPVIILDLLSSKMPYIILVILGYTTLIVMFVLWQNGYLNKLQNKENDKEQEEDPVQEDIEAEYIPEELGENKEVEEIEEIEEIEEVEEIEKEEIKQAEKLEEDIVVEEIDAGEKREKEEEILKLDETIME